MVGVCDVPVISSVCDTAGEAAASLVTAPFDWLAMAMGNSARWMFESVWDVFDRTTFVDATSEELTSVYGILFGVAVFVMVGFFVLQVMRGMMRREPAALSRAALGLAKSILGSSVALTLVASVLEITDQLCLGIVRAAGTNMEDMGGRISLLAAGLSGLSIAAPGAGAIVTIFISGLAIGAAALVWITLLIRKSLLLIAIVFAPIALAGATWDHTRAWVGRWASFVLALVLSKVVIVVIFLLATAQVSAPIDADLQSVGDPLAGVVLMLIAGFAPYLTYKAISFMGFDTHHAVSAEQDAKSALHPQLPLSLGGRSGGMPPKVLGQSDPVAPPAAGGPTAAAPANSSATSSVGSTGASAAAAGGVALLGAAVAEKSVTAGPALGRSVETATARQSDSAAASPPNPAGPPSPGVADRTLTGSGRDEEG